MRRTIAVTVTIVALVAATLLLATAAQATRFNPTPPGHDGNAIRVYPSHGVSVHAARLYP